ncbi:MAG: N-acetyltransferase [Candidatus Tritonobacter lacicola]|nr:N-acetyltransferase [Candidatus Tritonobacter lacicola]
MNYRKARLDDVEGIHLLIGHYARIGDLLPRSRNQLYEHLREFCIADDAGSIVGCGALHISWSDLAEIRSLVIQEDYQRRGIASRIVELCIEEALSLGVKKVFALTLPDRTIFFEKLGFEKFPKERLPHKIWSECIHCIKFPYECNEVAVMKNIED